MADECKVVIRGLAAGVDRQQVVANLARLFKTDAARIEMLLGQCPTVVKAGVPAEAGEKYRTALEQAGVQVEVIPLAIAAATSVAVPASRDATPAEGTSSGFPLWKFVIPAVAVLLAVLVVFNLDDEAPDAAAQSAAASAELGPVDGAPSNTTGSSRGRSPASMAKNEPSSLCLVRPEETRRVTVTGVVPVLHETTGSLQGTYRVLENPWEEFGFDVRIDDSYLSSDYHDIWVSETEWRNTGTGETGLVYSPIGSDGHIYRADPPAVRKGGDGWRLRCDPVKMLDIAKMSEKEARKQWRNRDGAAADLGRRGFVFYRFTLNLSVSVPGEEDLRKIDAAEHFDQAGLDFGPAELLYTAAGVTRDLAAGGFKHDSVNMTLSEAPEKAYRGVTLKGYRGITVACP